MNLFGQLAIHYANKTDQLERRFLLSIKHLFTFTGFSLSLALHAKQIKHL